MVEALENAGYRAGQEVGLCIGKEWRPVPVVIAGNDIEELYPTEPVDIVVEILSRADTLPEVQDNALITNKSALQPSL